MFFKKVKIMTKDNQEKVLKFMLEKTGQAIIKVRGISMLPILREGDNLKIENSEKYDVGDILVYNYNGEGLLVHRFLREDGVLVCKGDNAFRFEKISQDEVIGKVTFINGEKAKKWEAWKISLSFEIGKSFSKLNDLEGVKNSSLYSLYATLVLEEQLNLNVMCYDTYKSVIFDSSQYKCICYSSGGNIKEYCGIDGVIIFCAILKKPMQSFLDDIFGYFTNADCALKNKVYFRLCTLVENQTIVMKCLI